MAWDDDLTDKMDKMMDELDRTMDRSMGSLDKGMERLDRAMERMDKKLTARGRKLGSYGTSGHGRSGTSGSSIIADGTKIIINGVDVTSKLKDKDPEDGLDMFKRKDTLLNMLRIVLMFFMLIFFLVIGATFYHLITKESHEVKPLNKPPAITEKLDQDREPQLPTNHKKL